MNCEAAGEKPMEYVDSRIDLNGGKMKKQRYPERYIIRFISSGEIIIAKEADSLRTTPIDLQWMVMTCDPESAARETCDELPVREGG